MRKITKKSFYRLQATLLIIMAFLGCTVDEKPLIDFNAAEEISTVTDTIVKSPIQSRMVPFETLKSKPKVISALNNSQERLGKFQKSKSSGKLENYTVLKDEVRYIEYDSTHTFTFKLIHEKPKFYIENLVLHYNLDKESYDGYLIQYDLTPEEYIIIGGGGEIPEYRYVKMLALSADQVDNALTKSSTCFNACTTVSVSCSGSDSHDVGQSCPIADGDITGTPAYTYQSCSPFCYDAGPAPATIDEGTSGGGGGDGSKQVVTQPTPTEPCSDSSSDVGLSDGDGNCLIVEPEEETFDEQFPLLVNSSQNDYEKEILRLTNYLRGFGEAEDEYFADYVESLIPEFYNMNLGEVYDIYKMVRERVEFMRVLYLQAIVVPFAEAALPFIEYAVIEASLGAALPILRKIPISFVGRGARLEKMVREVSKLGYRGDQLHVRIVPTPYPVEKARELFKTLTKNALSIDEVAPSVIRANMGSGNYITYRTVSSTGFPATIDLNFPTIFGSTPKVIKFKL